MNSNYLPLLSPMKRVGQYSPKEWMKESEAQLKSSVFLRDIAKSKKGEVERLLQNHRSKKHRLEAGLFQHLFDKDAANKSSFLLLGYAIELVLKAGVVKYCRGLPDALVKESVKKYSHKSEKMAIDLGMRLESGEKEMLVEMEQMVRADGRYPLSEEDSIKHIELYNKLNEKFRDEEYYDAFWDIYQKLFAAVKLLDNDRANPSHVMVNTIDQDGYLVVRHGGGLPIRATIKYSSEQKESNKGNLSSLKDLSLLKELLTNNRSKCLSFEYILTNWNNANFYEHGKNDRPIEKNQEARKLNA